VRPPPWPAQPGPGKLIALYDDNAHQPNDATTCVLTPRTCSSRTRPTLHVQPWPMATLTTWPPSPRRVEAAKAVTGTGPA